MIPFALLPLLSKNSGPDGAAVSSIVPQKGLADRAVAASGWRFGTVAAQLLLQIVVLAILSRLLPPEDFGVLGIAMIFVAFATVVTDLGAGAALIQRRNLSQRHIRTTFTLSVGLGLFLALALALGAPIVGNLFRTPRVEPILRLLSLSYVFEATSLVPSALLWRDMRMRAVGIAEISGYALGFGVTGVTLALQGAGLWSLAWAVVVQSFLRTVLLSLLAGHAPRLGMWRQELRDVLGFGLGVSLTKLFNFAATKGDYVVVGRWLGSEALGLYERAYRLMEMPANYFAGVIARLLFPALSEIQDDRERMQRAFRTALVAVILVYAPAAVTLWVSAHHLIHALFGPQWIDAVAPLQVLCFGLVFRGAYKICDAAIRAKGAVYRSAWRVLVYAVLVLLGAAAGQRWGLVGVAVGVTAAITLRYALVAHLTAKLLDIGWWRLLGFHGAGATLAAAVGGILVVVESLATEAGFGSWACLSILAPTAAVTCILGVLSMPRSWLGRDLVELVFRLVRKRPPGKTVDLRATDPNLGDQSHER